MLMDGIELVEGSDAKNLVIEKGNTLPINITEGRLFYLSGHASLKDGLYQYADEWKNIGSGGGAVGSITYFPANAAPDTHLKLNGALLLRSEYPDLWQFAQNSGNITIDDASWGGIGHFSPGDGSTTFRLPDFRGYFVRNWDDGRGVDSGRGIGTWQADELKSHAHSFQTGFGLQGSLSGIQTSLAFTSKSTNSVHIFNTDGAETRPKNIPMLACIKY